MGRARIKCIVFCVLTAFLSGCTSAALDLVTAWKLPIEKGHETNHRHRSFWVYYSSSTLPACAIACIEVCTIYYLVLSCSIHFAHKAGLVLWPLNEERKFMVRSIIQNCFELPYPTNNLEGLINPLRGYSRLRLLFVMFLYRARISVSTYIVRVLGRRTIARAAAKVIAAFIIVPVIVFWDTLLAIYLTYNSMVLVIGPPQALKIFDSILDSNGMLVSFRASAAIFRVLSCAIVQKGEVHPVLYLLFRHGKHRLGLDVVDSRYGQDLDNVSMLMNQALPMLPRHEQVLVLRIMALTLVVDGSISSKERNYMMTALEACGCIPVVDELIQTTRKYAKGILSYADYEKMFSTAHNRTPASLSDEEKWDLWYWQTRNKIMEGIMSTFTLV